MKKVRGSSRRPGEQDDENQATGSLPAEGEEDGAAGDSCETGAEHRFRFAQEWERKRRRPQRASGGTLRMALLLLLGILGLAWWFLGKMGQR